jgi:tetratricopeptide (TPR) repeat protein
MNNFPQSDNRRIRVFVSSTFRDMMEERNVLMTHTWPELRRFCRERQVELVEVDLRWGIAEEQNTRKETLKLCLDEIKACRPFFIGLLGERYGWVPGDDAFTADLKEEQPWLKDLHGKSVTELEILHGVLNNPEMAERAFFYFRDPKYVDSLPEEKRTDFLFEDPSSAEKQLALKNLIRKTCSNKNIPLYEDYPDPQSVASIILNQLEDAIDKQFSKESITDPLTHEAHNHEAFAEIRRRTYIGRPDYFEALDRHCFSNGKPLLLLGESGSGKSALIANWVEHWQKEHPRDFIFQHYISSTTDSAVHWKLMTRLMGEIKRWANDYTDLPHTNDDILRDFSVWLAKARIKAERDGVKFIVVLDALNQLEDKDHAHTLGWLPTEPFKDNLRLIVSTLPGVTLEVLEKRSLALLRIEQLTANERRRMIVEYLKRFGKKLDAQRIEKLSNAKATANPLYLKILLDELRITGTYDKIDERLDDYLSAAAISTLLHKVLTRYQRDYEHDRKGLVSEALGLIWSARRGLTETELLQLLRSENLPQLPLATWSPFRAALDESLVDRGGILNFAHDFLRTAIESAFVPVLEKQNDFRIQLADYFEQLPPTARTCDELPWLLQQTELFVRLRNYLLNIDCFLEIIKRDEDELRSYWVSLGEEKSMGQLYLNSFNVWKEVNTDEKIFYGVNNLGLFLSNAALYTEVEPLYRFSLKINEDSFGKDNPIVAICLSNIATLLHATNRMSEAEPLMKRVITIFEKSFGENHPNLATSLNNLATLYLDTNRMDEAEPLMKKALKIDEENLGKDHPNVAIRLNSIAALLQATNRMSEAEPLYRRALNIDEESFGKDHPHVAISLNNLAQLLYNTNRISEAEPLMRKALKIDEESFGKDHPNVAVRLNNLAQLLKATNHFSEAEPLMKRALKINEESFGKDHPNVALDLLNLAQLLKNTNRLREAEPLMKRALKIDEESFGKNHPKVATDLNNLASLLTATNRLSEAEPLYRRALEIDEDSFGKDHPAVARELDNIAMLLYDTNRPSEAEPLMRRALKIDEESFGKDHPNVAIHLHNLAILLETTNRVSEAELLYRRALKINEEGFGKDHPNVALDLLNLAQLLKNTNRLREAEPLMRRALKIDEESFDQDHPNVANDLNYLGMLLKATNHLSEAESLSIRAVEILINFTRITGHSHPRLKPYINNYIELLQAMGWSEEKIKTQLQKIAPEFFK